MVLGIARRVAVLDHDRAIADHHGVAGGGFAAHVGERSADEDVLDPARLELFVEIGRALDEGAEARLFRDQVAALHVELGIQRVAVRAAGEARDVRGALRRREEIVVIEGPQAWPAFFLGDGQHDPDDEAAPVAHGRGEPVDIGDDVLAGLDAIDEEVLHVDDEERRLRRIETVEDVEAAALLHDPVDHVLRHGEVAHVRPPVAVCRKTVARRRPPRQRFALWRSGPAVQPLSKSGFRFSTKAAMPSFWPGVPNVAWNMRRSNRMPSARVVS